MVYLAAWESTGIERITTAYLMQHMGPKQKGVQHGAVGKGIVLFIYSLWQPVLFSK